MWWWFDAIISWTKLFLSTVSLSALLYERKPWRPFFLVKCIYQDKNMFSFFFFFFLIYIPIILFCLSLPNTSNGILTSQKKKKLQKRSARVAGPSANRWWDTPFDDALFYFPHAHPRAVRESRSPFLSCFSPLVCDAIRIVCLLYTIGIVI